MKRIKLPGLLRSRRRQKLSRLALGKRAKVGHNTLFQAEHRQPIRKDLAERLAKILGVKLVTLRSR